jgi:ribonuclease D
MELDRPQYIDTEAALRAWVERLAHADTVAVDTESDSLHHFREKVCLIQMTALGQDALIDPLALPNLEPLAALMADPSCTKIFHDAGYDLVSIGRDFDFKVQGIFDTMLASRLLGSKEFGLAAILKARFGFIADKRLQRSDWARRPLTDAQVSYARYDTHFLPELAEQLRHELRDTARLAWANEEFARLPDIARRANPRPIGPDPDGFWRIRGVRTLAPAAKGRLRSLCKMRDSIAARLDRPKFKVLGDTVILELAQDPPMSVATLARAGLRRGGVERFGAEIMAALASATPVQGGPPAGVVRRRRGGRFLDAEVRERYDRLRALRREKAEALGVDPEVALSNAVLEELSRHPPKTQASLSSRPDLQGWRQELFATDLYDCLARSPEAPAALGVANANASADVDVDVDVDADADAQTETAAEPRAAAPAGAEAKARGDDGDDGEVVAVVAPARA